MKIVIVTDGDFSFVQKKSFKFSDTNYAVASREDKDAMFLAYSELLNSFDSGTTTKITINNRRLNRLDLERNYKMDYAGDFLDVYREEKNGIMLNDAPFLTHQSR